MIVYALKYALSLLVTLLAVSIFIFAINEYSPGDAARKMVGQYATQEQVDLVTRQLGLDRPVHERYLTYLSSIATGNFGESLLFKRPVSEVLWSRLQNTAVLAGIAFAFIVPLAAFLGLLGGVLERSIFGRTVQMFNTCLASIPEYALGVFLITIFATWLAVLPGTASLGTGGGWSQTSQLMLPIATMILADLGYVASVVAASVTETMKRQFMRTAILKGLSPMRCVCRHLLPNAIITPVTVIFLQLNYLISGVVVIEALFAYPGFGRMMLDAALHKDIALIEAGALVAVIIAMLTQVLSDAAYFLLDPRARA